MAKGRTDMRPHRASRTDQRFPRLVWVLFALLVMQGPFPGLVLCFASNSHLAVETSHNNFHPPTSPDSEGPCLDIPLANVNADGQVVASAPGPVSPQVVPVLGMPAVPLTSWVKALASDPLSPSLLAVHGLIASLRTVLLRI
jgi:hypothetical protein